MGEEKSQASVFIIGLCLFLLAVYGLTMLEH